MEKKRIMIWMSLTEIDRLKKLVRDTGLTISGFVRMLIHKELKKEKR